jgi:hypothetical protein
MIINNGRILGNGDKIFKAQIVDSFVQFNSPYQNNLIFNLSGVTGANPFHVYYETPIGITKYTYITDGYYNIPFYATSEFSFKEFYFAGNLDSLRSLEFSNQYIGYGFIYKGDLKRLLNQFPNLQSFIMNYGSNNSYDYSQFNQNISGMTFPVNIKTFQIADSTLSGDINTIANFNKINDLELIRTQLSGNLDSGFTHINKLSLDYLNYLNGNINTIFINNPNLSYLDLNQCPLISLSGTTLDISKLKYLNIDLTNMPNVIGNISGWIFNTGLTSFTLKNNQYLMGDLTNWNIGNTQIHNFFIFDNQNNFPLDSKFTGSLSGWTLPSTLTAFALYFSSGITSVPINFSGCTDFQSIQLYSVIGATQNINDFKFNNNIQYFNIYNYYGKSKFYGNFNTFTMPTGLTTIIIQNSKISGNIALQTFSSNITYIDLSNNYLTGNVANVTTPNALTYFTVDGNTGMTMNFSNTPYYSGKTIGVFHAKNINHLFFSNLGEITGDLSNLIFDNPISELHMNDNNFNCNLSKLNLENLQFLDAHDCPTLYGNLTNWFTGTTALNELNLNNDVMLSGDTTDWNVNSISRMVIDNTNLSGTLKLNNVAWLSAANTKINSNIATDFNFSNQAYYVDIQDCKYVTGNLSGVTLGYMQYQFNISNCTGITGSNSFINYLFINRKNFTQNQFYIYMQNIGDSVTGGTKILGDTGTFPIGTGGTDQWNLTESQVNFLVQGLDYTGVGTNIPWTQGQKVYWMENAKISNINLNLRYIYYQINY